MTSSMRACCRCSDSQMLAVVSTQSSTDSSRDSAGCEASDKSSYQADGRHRGSLPLGHNQCLLPSRLCPMDSTQRVAGTKQPGAHHVTELAGTPLRELFFGVLRLGRVRHSFQANCVGPDDELPLHRDGPRSAIQAERKNWFQRQPARWDRGRGAPARMATRIRRWTNWEREPVQRLQFRQWSCRVRNP